MRQSFAGMHGAVTIGAVVLGFLLWALPSWAQTPPPCSDSETVNQTATIPAGITVLTAAIDMHPCHTLSAEVTVTAPQAVPHIGVTVNLLGATGYNLVQAGGTQAGSVWSKTLPENVAPNITPYRGTRGSGGLVRQIRLNVGSPASGSYSVSITWSLTKRDGYNIGGDAIGTAPPVDPGVTYRGSLHAVETNGQNWQLTLAPGQKFYVTGHREAHPQATAPFYVEVRSPSGTLIKTLFGGSTNGFQYYSSQTHTNTTGAPVTVYVRLSTLGVIADFSADFWIDNEKPLLTLYLDVRSPDDNDVFMPTSATPEDESPQYVPGSRLDGSSETLPAPNGTIQSYVQVIAAYRASNNNRIVSPPSSGNVTVALTNGSAFKGTAMNYGDTTDPDFTFPSGQTSLTLAFGTDKTARTFLDCNDYGGFVTRSVRS